MSTGIDWPNSNRTGLRGKVMTLIECCEEVEGTFMEVRSKARTYEEESSLSLVRSKQFLCWLKQTL
jgi:hypothetical protein